MWPANRRSRLFFSVSSEIYDRFDYVFFAVSGSFPVMPLSQQRMLSDFSLSATHFPKHFLSIVPHPAHMFLHCFSIFLIDYFPLFDPFPVLLCNCLLPATHVFFWLSALFLFLFCASLSKSRSDSSQNTSIMQCQK